MTSGSRPSTEGSRVRCAWASTELSTAYHDTEWGVPCHDDRTLFEFLVLEGAQAGLSWETILKKRHHYRRAFSGFDPDAVACFNERKRSELLKDAGLVRNRLKIAAAVANAQAFLRVKERHGTFDRYVWQFVGGQPRVNEWRVHEDVPARTLESEAMSRDLVRRGFRFVGPTICYAFMQAVGMVNDHLVQCFRHRAIIHPGR